jgi:hypothetical protein
MLNHQKGKKNIFINADNNSNSGCKLLSTGPTKKRSMTGFCEDAIYN